MLIKLKMAGLILTVVGLPPEGALLNPQVQKFFHLTAVPIRTKYLIRYFKHLVRYQSWKKRRGLVPLQWIGRLM